jgi:hypothetical protein
MDPQDGCSPPFLKRRNDPPCVDAEGIAAELTPVEIDHGGHALFRNSVDVRLQQG